MLDSRTTRHIRPSRLIEWIKRRIFLRVSILAIGGFVALCIIFFAVAYHTHTLQDWIDSQLESIADACLNPRLTFTDLSYEAPRTVSLRNFHLIADDPAHPGKTIDILACDRVEIALADVPTIGKPLVIQRISLTDPLIAAVAVGPHSGRFVGFSDLVRGANSDDSRSRSPSHRKLSDDFQMRLVSISNGKIVYDPRIAGTVPMTLDKINTVLKIEPTEPGWYRLNTSILRVPVFDLRVKGQLNLDSLAVKEADIQLLADLGREKLDYLPPELQALLKRYDAKGKLTASVTGAMPLTSPADGQAAATLSIDRANLKLGGVRVPVEGLLLKSELQHRRLDLSLLRIDALGGTATLTGAVDLNDRLDGNLRLGIRDMIPQRLLVSAALAAQAEAELNLDLTLAASLKSLFGQAPPPLSGPLASLELSNFALTSPDPRTVNQRLDVLGCRRLAVTLTDPILSGRPLGIGNIILDSPRLAAVSVSPGSMQFVGVPSAPWAQTSANRSGPPPSAQSSAPIPSLSSIVRLRHLEINGARFLYDPRIPHTQPMLLNPVDASLDGDPRHAGAYWFQTSIHQPPAFMLDIHGGIDFDNPGLQNFVLDLAADLSQGRLNFLPPQVQIALGRLSPREKLSIHAAATASLSDPTRASAQLECHLHDINLQGNRVHVPVNEIDISGQAANGEFRQTIRIAALDSHFDLQSRTILNDRLDTRVSMSVQNLDIEPLAHALWPDAPASESSAKITGQLELNSPLLIAMGAVAASGSEPAATLDLHDFRLTTEDPITSQPMDCLAWKDFCVKAASLFEPGEPLVVSSIDLQQPAIRAVAIAPQSKSFAGFEIFQKIASLAHASSPGESPAQTSPPAVQSAGKQSSTKLGRIFRLDFAAIEGASIYYDPRIEYTRPFFLAQIGLNVVRDPVSDSRYRFDAMIDSKPRLSLALAGALDFDSLSAAGLSLDLKARMGDDSSNYECVPPELQASLAPEGLLHLTASGNIPMTHPLDLALASCISADNLKFSAGEYRLPIDAIRLPINISQRQLHFTAMPDPKIPTIAAFDGTINLRGIVCLNDQIDSTLSLKTDNILLQDIMACKPNDGKPPDIMGATQLDLELTQAPLLRIMHAIDPPTPANTPAPAATQSSSPLYMTDLPARWGGASIQLTHARLAGLEIVQGLSNLAKSIFSGFFTSKHGNSSIKPEEHAFVACDFRGNEAVISTIHYEGELVEADGSGTITLQQYMDLYLTGGLLQKLAGLGGFGHWVKAASDSLLYYHVYGKPHNINFEVKRGNGQPIANGVNSVAKKAGNGINTGLQKAGEGLNKAGQFFGGLFHKHHSDDPGN